MLIPSTLFNEPHFPFLRNVLYCTEKMRKREPINVCFVGQMKYMHHRNKLAGVMHYANRHPEFALQPFDYTQIPPGLCQSLLANMKLDGLIFGDGTALSTFDAYRRAHDVPTVVIDPLTFAFQNTRPPDVAIELNHTEICNRIADFFIKRRHINFAYIGYDSDTWIPLDRIRQRSALREAAFSKRVRDKGFSCDILNISGRLDQSETETIARWLANLPKPCAVMAFWDNLARDVANIARRSGIRIPDQLVIMGTDNDVLVCESAQPTLSTIVLDFEGAGYLAADELSRLVRTGRPLKKPKRLSYGTREIIERTSTSDFKGVGRIVGAAREYIRQHASEGIGMPDVARFVGVSPRVLQLRFAEVLGHSVIAEIGRVKLDAVKRLLMTTSLPPSEIAERCGYSAHHLVNFFKRKTGCSMTRWRKTRS